MKTIASLLTFILVIHLQAQTTFKTDAHPVLSEGNIFTRQLFDPDFDGNALVWYDFMNSEYLRLKGDTILTAFNKLNIASVDSISADLPEYAPLFDSDSGAIFSMERSEEMYNVSFAHDIPLTLYMVISSDESDIESTCEIFSDVNIGDYYIKKYNSRTKTNGIISDNLIVPYKPFIIVYKITNREYLYINNYVNHNLNIMGSTLEGLNFGYYSNAIDNMKIKEFVIRDGADSDITKERLVSELTAKYDIDTATPNYLKDRYVAILGNSTIGDYPPEGLESITYYMNKYGYYFFDMAISGHAIADQLTTWKSMSALNKSSLNYVIINEGLLDLDPDESITITLDKYQVLIDSINQDISATCKTIILTMTPCKAWCVSTYGAVDGLIAYQKWIDMNESIMGNGAYPLIGLDFRIDEHTTEMNDGSGNLKVEYNIDGIHENNLGREFIADLIEALIE